MSGNHRFISTALLPSLLLALSACDDAGQTQSSDSSQGPGVPGEAAMPTPTTTPISANTLRPGLWGGSRSSINARETGEATFRSGCVTATIPAPLSVNPDGTFSWSAPITQNGVSESTGPRATFTGTVDGDSLDLHLSYTDSQGDPIVIDDRLTYGFEGPLLGPC